MWERPLVPFTPPQDPTCTSMPYDSATQALGVLSVYSDCCARVLEAS